MPLPKHPLVNVIPPIQPSNYLLDCIEYTGLLWIVIGDIMLLSFLQINIFNVTDVALIYITSIMLALFKLTSMPPNIKIAYGTINEIPVGVVLWTRVVVLAWYANKLNCKLSEITDFVYCIICCIVIFAAGIHNGTVALNTVEKMDFRVAVYIISTTIGTLIIHTE